MVRGKRATSPAEDTGHISLQGCKGKIGGSFFLFWPPACDSIQRLGGVGPRLRVTLWLVLVCCAQLLPAEARPRLHVPGTRPALVLSQDRLLDGVTFIAGTQLRVAVAQECARLTFAVSDIPLQGPRCSVALNTPSLFCVIGNLDLGHLANRAGSAGCHFCLVGLCLPHLPRPSPQ